jgi:hypothetical protein
MGKMVWTFLCILIFLSLSLSGCYYFSATSEMKAAEKLISELKAAGGATLVPYEYCSAESFLGNAKGEADENDWKHARDFATRSKSAAEAGLAAIKKK